MINIILADDHIVVRNGIKLLLESDPTLNIIDEAVSGIEVLEQLKNKQNVDIILADLNMPEMSGMQLLVEIATLYPTIPVIILTMVDDENMITEAFNLGAKGYVLKNSSSDELIYCISHVVNGGKYMSADLSQLFFRKALKQFNASTYTLNTIEFSSREIEVLDLIAQGFTNAEMADKLFLSTRTVEGHRQSLIDKTKSKNTAVLIKYAVKHGLIS